MQLSTLVLPAPFGPISANSSPAATANDTASSTLSPPKLRARRSTSSSAIPSPPAAILLHGAIGAACAAGLAEVELLNVLMAAQPGGVSVEHHPAVLQHIAVVGNVERNSGGLLDHQDRDAELVADFDQAPHQLLDHDRRKAERHFVDQQQFG